VDDMLSVPPRKSGYVAIDYLEELVVALGAAAVVVDDRADQKIDFVVVGQTTLDFADSKVEGPYHMTVQDLNAAAETDSAGLAAHMGFGLAEQRLAVVMECCIQAAEAVDGLAEGVSVVLDGIEVAVVGPVVGVAAVVVDYTLVDFHTAQVLAE
jgi:hypothetical protein